MNARIFFYYKDSQSCGHFLHVNLCFPLLMYNNLCRSKDLDTLEPNKIMTNNLDFVFGNLHSRYEVRRGQIATRRCFIEGHHDTGAKSHKGNWLPRRSNNPSGMP